MAGGPPSTPAGQCPFGFGSSQQHVDNDADRNFRDLVCVVCQALIYDAVESDSCGHKYCLVCINRLKDCPICGDDVPSYARSEETNKTIDTYLQTHINSESPPGMEAVHTTPLFPDGIGGKLPPSVKFLFRQALTASQGGNNPSGIARMKLAIRQTEKALSNTFDTTDENAMRQCFAAMLGKLGDFHATSGLDGADEAKQWYEKAMSELNMLPMDSESVSRDLAVTYAKLGDLAFSQYDLGDAREMYECSLDIRRSAVDKHGQPSQVMDLAVGLAKMGDIHGALRQFEQGITLFQEALALLEKDELGEESLETKREAYIKMFTDSITDLQARAHDAAFPKAKKPVDPRIAQAPLWANALDEHRDKAKPI